MVMLHLRKVFNKIINLFRNVKGLSLTEIVASIAIVMILMVYGLAFFNAAWKFRAENEEYSTVLETVAGNMDSLKFKAYSTGAANADYILGSGVSSETFRGHTVHYSISKGSAVTLAYPITSLATLNDGNIIRLDSYVYKKWDKASYSYKSL